MSISRFRASGQGARRSKPTGPAPEGVPRGERSSVGTGIKRSERAANGGMKSGYNGWRLKARPDRWLSHHSTIWPGLLAISVQNHLPFGVSLSRSYSSR